MASASRQGKKQICRAQTTFKPLLFRDSLGHLQDYRHLAHLKAVSQTIWMIGRLSSAPTERRSSEEKHLIQPLTWFHRSINAPCSAVFLNNIPPASQAERRRFESGHPLEQKSGSGLDQLQDLRTCGLSSPFLIQTLQNQNSGFTK